MILKILERSQYGSFKVVDINGKTFYAKPSKFLDTPIEEGKSYDMTIGQKEGQKTKWINKAKEVADDVELETIGVITKAGYKPVADKVTEKVTNDDKMTKADWAKKDDGIKWLACIKAAAEFHARRSDSIIANVIDDATKLYMSAPDITAMTEKEKDIFEENEL